MAKGGKLTKLRSAIKRWPSFTKLSRNNSSSTTADYNNYPKEKLRAVYVGKSRRRYLVRHDIVEHPVFQELLDKSGDDEQYGIVVACEVVLFEHLLWMLENNATQMESMDELVDYYTC